MIDLYDLEVKIEEEKPIAVGECGLDYVKVKDQNKRADGATYVLHTILVTLRK